MKVDFKGMQKHLEASLNFIEGCYEKATSDDSGGIDVEVLDYDEMKETAQEFLKIYQLLRSFTHLRRRGGNMEHCKQIKTLKKRT